MNRESTAREHEAILGAVAAGDRVQAISVYMAATGCDLTQAQSYVRALIEESQAGLARESTEGAPKKGLFRMFRR